MRCTSATARVRLHAMACADNELGRNPVEMCAAIRNNAVRSSLHRAVALHRDDRVNGYSRLGFPVSLAYDALSFLQLSTA